MFLWVNYVNILMCNIHISNDDDMFIESMFDITHMFSEPNIPLFSSVFESFFPRIRHIHSDDNNCFELNCDDSSF